MSRYIMIRRLRGPAFLLLVGVIALLNQADVLTWGKSWPLFLILWGVLMLAERAALATEEGVTPYPGVPYPGAAYPGAPGVGGFDPVTGQPVAGQNPTETGTAIVPTPPTGIDKYSDGGQS